MFGIASSKELNRVKLDYEALKDQYDSLNSTKIKLQDYYMKQQEENGKELKKLNDEISKKDDEIEKLKSKIDILHKYYDMDSEPTQEIKTKMRIDERVHELELENIELRNLIKIYIQMDITRLENNLNYYTMQYRAQQAISPYPYYSLPYYSHGLI